MSEVVVPSQTDATFGGRRRTSTEDLISEELRELLVNRELEPGSQVSEESLAATLGVSRTPLRHAISRLAFEGLVDRSANGRLYVTPISVEDAKNVFSVRMALEQLALEQAFPHLTENLLLSLRGLLAQMAVLGENSRGSVGRYGGEFHAMLYRSAENNVNLALLSMLQGRIDRYRFLSTARGIRRQQRAVQEHQLILDALERRDLRAARRALHDHLATAQESVLTALAELAAKKTASES